MSPRARQQRWTEKFSGTRTVRVDRSRAGLLLWCLEARGRFKKRHAPGSPPPRAGRVLTSNEKARLDPGEVITAPRSRTVCDRVTIQGGFHAKGGKGNLPQDARGRRRCFRSGAWAARGVRTLGESSHTCPRVRVTCLNVSQFGLNCRRVFMCNGFLRVTELTRGWSIKVRSTFPTRLHRLVCINTDQGRLH